MALSVENEDGSPATLSLPKVGTDPDQWPIKVSTALSASFGMSSFQCVITDVVSTFLPPAGFWGLELELRNKGELGGSLVGIGPTAFDVIAEDGTSRGQAVIVGSTVIRPQEWWPQQENEPPDR
jgi:hypothetical protein